MGASQLSQKLWPKDFRDLRRYGRDHDGGYVMPASSFRAADSLLSFGLNFDWSFEREFAAAHPNAPIHAFSRHLARVMHKWSCSTERLTQPKTHHHEARRRHHQTLQT